MKKITVIMAFVATALAQKCVSQNSIKKDNASQLLTSYLKIKNALVAGDAVAAADNAQLFVKVANTIDYNIISEGNIHVLINDAGKIAAAKDLKNQRLHFADFSANMASVARAVKLSDQPIYQAYCPMKKSYWLSSEKAIKNPYYGSMMLTCGQVTDTLE